MASLLNIRIPIARCFTRGIEFESKLPTNIRKFEQIRHAGHAKWQNIAGTKSANDQAKGKMCSKYVMMIKRAIFNNDKQTDPKLNRQLAAIISEAMRNNMPKATIERAIARTHNMRTYSVTLEIGGPGGSSIVVRCETENVSNLRKEIKKLLKKYDVNLLAENSVLNMFKTEGLITAAKNTKDGRPVDQNFAEEAAILANAHEVLSQGSCENGNEVEHWVFTTDAESLNATKGELEKMGLDIKTYVTELVPYREIDFGSDVRDKVFEIVDILKEHEQVIDVCHNVAGAVGTEA